MPVYAFALGPAKLMLFFYIKESWQPVCFARLRPRPRLASPRLGATRRDAARRPSASWWAEVRLCKMT